MLRDTLTIQARLPDLEAVLRELEEDEEDAVYRYFHQSWKVFNVQDSIKTAFQLLVEIGGDADPPFDELRDIVKAGTEVEFDMERTNADWEAETEPILKALWYTRYFMTQMVRHASTLESTMEFMPPGWAAVLYVYNLRQCEEPRSAILYTIIENFRRRGVEPYTYLRDVRTRLPQMTNWQIREVTPKAWAKAITTTTLRAVCVLETS